MKVYWDLKLKANNEDEALAGISAFEKLTGLTATCPKVAAYWKMPEYFEARFSTEDFSDDPDVAIKELRAICEKIGNDWNDNKPYLYPKGLEWSRTIDSRTAAVYLNCLFWAHCQFVAE